jgi:hypothetical protein
MALKQTINTIPIKYNKAMKIGRVVKVVDYSTSIYPYSKSMN